MVEDLVDQSHGIDLPGFYRRFRESLTDRAGRLFFW